MASGGVAPSRRGHGTVSTSGPTHAGRHWVNPAGRVRFGHAPGSVSAEAPACESPALLRAVPPAEPEPMTIFERLGRIAYRRRWRIVAAWAVLLAVALPLAPRASGALHAGGFNLADLQSSRARAG